MMKKTTRKRAAEIEAILQPWAETGLALEIIDRDIARLFTVAESPLSEAIWKLYDAYTDALEAKIGPVAYDWLSWFYADNQFGRRGMQASSMPGVATRKIRTVGALALFLAEIEEGAQ